MLVILATSSLVAYMASSSQAEERQKKVVDDICQFIIQQYELGLPFLSKHDARQHPRPNPAVKQGQHPNPTAQPPHPKSRHFFAMQIFDGDSLIYQNKPFVDPKKLHPFNSFTSESGKTYRIFASKPQIQRFVMGALKILTTLQLILILITSGLVSFILSWTISRPLKQLSHFSQQVTHNENDPQLPSKLLARRDEIGDLANHIKMMLETIEQKIQEQQNLLHDVSHEIRAPLARLQAVTALMEQQPSKIETHGKHLHEECDRIDKLLQRILDFSRVDHIALSPTAFDFTQLVEEQTEKLKLECSRRQVIFSRPNSPHTLNGYKELAECAIENILRNAHKYSPIEKPIDISFKDTQNTIELSIRDYGSGINEQEKDRLTQTFYRADNTMHTDGFGLGLSITQRIMNKHKGKLLMTNYPEAGLEVTLAFPKT